MSQNIWNSINPSTTSGTQLATLLNDFKNAVVSGLSGASRPTELLAGGTWVDTSVSGFYSLKIYDGTADINLFTINLTTGAAAISGSDSSFAITKTSNDIVAPVLDFVKSRIAGGGQVLDNDVVLEIKATSKTDAGSPAVVGRIRCIADESHTASALGSYWSIEGVAEGTSALYELIRIRQDKMEVLTTALLTAVEFPKVDIATAATITSLSANTTLVKFTGSTETHIQGVDNIGKARTLILHNGSTANVILDHQNAGATAAKRFILPNGLPVTIPPNTSAEIFYDSTDTRWKMKSSSGSSSTVAAEYVKLDVATTATITALTATNTLIRFTGSTNTEIQGIDSAGNAKYVILHNASSAIVSLSHANVGALAANRLTLPGSASISISPGNTAELFYDSSDSLWRLKSTSGSSSGGSGSGVENFIVNGNADTAPSSIFTPYADAAGTRPVDGTGGSPTVTTSITSTNPLNGTKSFLLTKPASNVQGQGWSVLSFSVPLQHRGKSLKISIPYIVNSGTFVPGHNQTTPVDGDVIWYIRDVTNSINIEPSNIKMFSSDAAVSDTFEATFQASTTGSDYRLIAHVASTSTLAFELKVDNVSVSPSVNVYGTPVTDTSLLTVTATNVSLTSQSVWGQLVGDTLNIKGKVVFSGAPTGSIGLSISGYSFETAKLPASKRLLNGASAEDVGTGVHYGSVEVVSSSLLNFYGDDGSGIWNATNPFTWVSGDELSIDVSIPVVGYSSSTKASDSYDTRSIILNARKSTAQSIPNTTSTTVTSYDTPIKDSAGFLNAATGIWTSRISADVVVFGRVPFAASATGIRSLDVFVDGVFYENLYRVANPASSDGQYPAGSCIVPVVSGTQIDLRVSQTSGGALNLTASSPEYFKFQIFRIQSPQSLTQGNKIVCSYRQDSGQSLASPSRIIFNLKEVDNFNAYNTTTGIFKAPRTDSYRVSFNLTSITSAATLDNVVVRLAGVAKARAAKMVPTAGQSQAVLVTFCFEAKQGEEIDIYNQGSYGGVSLYNSSADNFFTIESVN